ncbi:thiamine ABC transporter permease [Sporosarcina sp. BI001-red]|uniref:ECF transporter S component n=1 Tax=Sporosarcina sp. BI001-red TaxID=2282866 RepID=UPI000E287F6F|nr:ECF transporter S component [Sporosarcina sp. BI001-red]REB05578.1 thiamine ABC transporter permease [Sporosarcina sp. BI001-red]
MKKLTFTDLLITIMVGVVFGILMKFWDDLYTVVKPMMPVARQLLYGMWFMTGVFAFLLIRKPGVALIASIAGAGLSAFIGHGLEVLIYGFAQGLAAELLFAAFRYRKFSMVIAGVAGVFSCAASFGLDMFYGYADLETWALVVKYGLRAISAFIFTGVFAVLIVRALEATGVTQSIRPVAKEEYSLLDR